MFAAASPGVVAGDARFGPADPVVKGASHFDPKRPIERELQASVPDGFSAAAVGDLIISRPLSQDGVFPRLLTDMLAIGEESGDMSGALEHIGRRYDNELDRAVKLLTTILEPIMMLAIAVGVGFVAISMLLAVFELTSGLNT